MNKVDKKVIEYLERALLINNELAIDDAHVVEIAKLIQREEYETTENNSKQDN